MKVIKAGNADDQQLLEGLLRSDRRSVEAIYTLALPSVIHWVCENNGSEADARDIFQEALIALFRKVEGREFVLTCTLKSFIRIMCRNLWLSRLRNKGNQAGPLEGIEPVELGEDMEERLERSEREQLFFKHFDQLGEQCRKIMQWFFDKVPLKEIASRLDTSENYIKKRKFICKEKLIKTIQGDPMFNELNTK
jgi:RNA polymerase sigma factor (sigma-70 family)